MSGNGQVERNIDLAFDLIRHAVLEPSALDEVEAVGRDGALVFFDPDDKALTRANTATAQRLEARGEKVVRVEVQRRVAVTPVLR
jgi:hypothetical protein